MTETTTNILSCGFVVVDRRRNLTTKDAGVVTVLDDLSGFFEAGHLSAIMGRYP